MKPKAGARVLASLCLGSSPLYNTMESACLRSGAHTTILHIRAAAQHHTLHMLQQRQRTRRREGERTRGAAITPVDLTPRSCRRQIPSARGSGASLSTGHVLGLLAAESSHAQSLNAPGSPGASSAACRPPLSGRGWSQARLLVLQSTADTWLQLLQSKGSRLEPPSWCARQSRGWRLSLSTRLATERLKVHRFYLETCQQSGVRIQMCCNQHPHPSDRARGRCSREGIVVAALPPSLRWVWSVSPQASWPSSSCFGNPALHWAAFALFRGEATS